MGKEGNGLGGGIGEGQPTGVLPTAGSGHLVGQVRGVLAQEVIISTPLDPFLSLKALASYSGLSVRKLREYLTDPSHPLPHYRIGGKVLVRRSDYDAWAARFRHLGHPDVDRLVSEVLADLSEGCEHRRN
jgi:hypothetical protein